MCWDWSCWAISIASAPLEACKTVYPCSWSIEAMVLRTDGSSSAKRMVLLVSVVYSFWFIGGSLSVLLVSNDAFGK